MTALVFRWLPIGLTWFAVVFRAPTVRRSRAAFFFWFTTVWVAAALTLDLPQVEAAINGVPNLIYLVKYSMVLGAAACTREALANLPSAPPRRRRSRLISPIGWLLAVSGMTIGWLIAPVHDEHAVDQFTEVYAGVPELIPLWVCYLGFLGWMLVNIIRTQATYLSLPPSPVRTGMLTIGLGAIVGGVYVGHKALFLAVALLPGSPADWLRSPTLDTVLLGISVLLLIGGGLWPAFARLRTWWDSLLTYYALEPLWRLLTTAVPEVVLTEPGKQSVSERAEGRVVEIRDALNALPQPRETNLLAAVPERQRHAVALLDRGAEELRGSLQELGIGSGGDDVAQLRRLSNALVRAERPRGTHLDALARGFTNVLAPAFLVAVTVIVVACAEAGVVHGALWAAVTLLFAPGIPLAVIVLGVRQQWWSDRHVRVRRQRPVPLGVALVSILVCLALLRAARAPQAIGALVIAMTAGLAVSLIVTLVWKVSIHSAVAAGSAVVFGIQLGRGWAVFAALAVVAVGWSRCHLRDHTPAQVALGTVLGAGVAGGIFAPLVG